MSAALFVYITAALLTAGSTNVPIPGLHVTLPALSPLSSDNSALVTFSAGAPYATGTNFPGVSFAIVLSSAPTVPLSYGAITYDTAAPASYGRRPISIQALIPLTNSSQNVTVTWSSARNSAGIIDSFTSLSAVFVRA
eukprot:TRINITY_DN3673_c0_g6_i1.p1 TRINITY_DN3673_c0_g6~~TRINITY_DN3673_c0_g6_i1.p1  ORF type:complete len:138 (-),score=21.17 TRINITY_DN3673_c0_g6_i1:109-522(-)